MPQTRYNLIFRGEIAPNRSREAVKRNVAALFRVDRKSVEPLFSGKTVILKQQAELRLARKCRSAFERAGAICYVKPLGASNTEDSELWN